MGRVQTFCEKNTNRFFHVRVRLLHPVNCALSLSGVIRFLEKSDLGIRIVSPATHKMWVGRDGVTLKDLRQFLIGFLIQHFPD